MTRSNGTTGGTSSRPIEEEKERLRRTLSERVRALPDDVRARADEAICRTITAMEAFRRARQVLAYHALTDEVDVSAVIEHAWRADKRVFLPVMQGDGDLLFRRWSEGEALERGAHGVEVPRVGEEPVEDASIVIVPGRGYDRFGGRLGRGKGCYDRTLDRLAALGPTVGVGYSCQVVERIPCGPRDRPVHFLVTERGLLWASGGMG